MAKEVGCLCCTNSTSRLIKLTDKANVPGAEEKSYKDILYEMAVGIIENIGECDEFRLPNEACRKCLRQLKQSYSFLLQVKASHEYFLELYCPAVDCKETYDTNNLLETLIEIPGNIVPETESLVEHKKEVKEEEDTFEPQELELDQIIEFSCNDQSITEDIETFAESGDERQANLSSTEESDVQSLDEIDMLHEPIAVRCEICQKIYQDKQALYIHKRYTHMPDEEKTPCTLCSYKTSRPSALKVHMKLKHSTQCSFTCNLCERSYTRRDDLTRHIKRVHTNTIVTSPKPIRNEEYFLCPHCGQSYSSKKMLDSHLFTHSVERPHPCGICDKTFKRIKDMKTHQLIHSDAKPFQCSSCGKSFKRSDKLKIHMRVHSELRPYKCQECEKTFKYPSVLRTHMHMHTGQTPYSCKTCGAAFSLRTSLNNHCLKNGHVKLTKAK